jgi:hypothetical protein
VTKNAKTILIVVLISLIMCLLGGIPAAFIFVGTFLEVRSEQEFSEKGIRGKAKVLKLQDTGSKVNGNPRVSLTLEVTIPNYPTFQTEHTQIVEMIRLPQVQPDSTIDVLVIPAEPISDGKIKLLLK